VKGSKIIDDFIPTVDDWNNFLGKWSEAIFDSLDEEYKENYEFQILWRVTLAFGQAQPRKKFLN
jgi:hypothetical protein